MDDTVRNMTESVPITVNVTDDHIDLAYRILGVEGPANTSGCCPLALALQEATGYDAGVSYTTATVDSGRGVNGYKHNNEKIVRGFDRWESYPERNPRPETGRVKFWPLD